MSEGWGGLDGNPPAMFTAEEMERLRKQKREANAEARAEVRRRGVKLHPKVAAMKAHPSKAEQKR